jgi:release factor glutamine methyltransferase
MDIRSALKEAMYRLREGRVPSHTLAAELLLMHVTGRDRAWLYAHPEEPLESAQKEHFFELVARRIAGTPTQYLTGKQEFWGLEFEVSPAVLIPRPETEHVVEVTLERMGVRRRSSPAPGGAGLRIADVGTGSGCLAVALAKEFPEATLVATDISADALAIAGRNAARHGLSDRIQFVHCSLLDAFLPSPLAPQTAPLLFDLIVSNPPYVGRDEADLLSREVRAHEPPEALFPGQTGGELYAPLIEQAEQLLRSGGVIAFEIGCGALERVRPLLADSRVWTCVGVTNDLAGIPRVLAAERV